MGNEVVIDHLTSATAAGQQILRDVAAREGVKQARLTRSAHGLDLVGFAAWVMAQDGQRRRTRRNTRTLGPMQVDVRLEELLTDWCEDRGISKRAAVEGLLSELLVPRQAAVGER